MLLKKSLSTTLDAVLIVGDDSGVLEPCAFLLHHCDHRERQREGSRELMMCMRDRAERNRERERERESRAFVT